MSMPWALWTPCVDPGPKPRPLDSLRGTVHGIYSLYQTRRNFQRAPISVRRTSDNATIDILFDANGVVDATAIGNHCGASTGYIVEWRDQQPGSTRTATADSTSRQYQIWTGSAIRKAPGTNTIAAYIEDTTRGYSANIGSTYNGTGYTAVVAASFTNTVVGSDNGISNFPRFAGLTSSTNNDSGGSARAGLIARKGGQTPAATWTCLRTNAELSTKAGVYSTFASVFSIFDGTNHTMYVDGVAGTSAISTSSFSATKLLLTNRGGATLPTPSSCPGAYVTEFLFIPRGIDSVDRALIHSYHSTVLGTPA